MARGTTLKGTKFLIKIGDGGSPEVFEAPCLLTTKTGTITTAVSEVALPDCDDPDAAAWIEREAISKSMTISGSGTLEMEVFHDVYQPWSLEGDPRRNIRLEYEAAAPNGGYYAGAFLLTSFGDSSTDRELVTVDLELMSDGEVTWTAAP